MRQIQEIILLFVTTALSYLISISGFTAFLPQFTALLAILFIVFTRLRLPTIYLISGIVTLIVFATDGLSSPLFFLVYFILFTTALTLHPVSSLSHALTLIIFLAHTLNSLDSLYTLISLALISPLAWFVSRKSESEAVSKNIIARDETDFLLWLNLKFKTGITTVIDLASQLSSSPLNYTQQQQVKKIKSSAQSLLNSAQKLTSEISSESDET